VKTKAETKAVTPAAPVDEARRLIDSAARQPGVVELFKVYESWQRFDRVFEVHNRIVAAKQVVSTSSSCGPMLRQLA